MGRVRIAAFVAVAVGVLVAPPTSAAPRERAADRPVRTWAITRTKTGPIPFAVRIDVRLPSSDTPERGVLLVLGTYGQGRDRQVVEHSFTEFGFNLAPQSYGSPGFAAPCPAVCWAFDEVRGDGYLEMERSPTLSDWYVATYDLDVRLSGLPRGWRIREIPGALRVVQSDQAEATGISWTAEMVEHFSRAEAPGGAGGSWVYATIPCTSGGVGSATLTGGSVEGGPTMTCASYAAATAIGTAPRRTRWSLIGDVTGWTRGRTRLAVFDLPA